MVKSKQGEHVSESTIVFSLIALIAVIVLGFYFWGTDTNKDQVVQSECEFPGSATDLRSAGLKLSEEISGTVGYSHEGFLTIESTNGFVLLTPVTDETHIDELIRDQIIQVLGCDGATELAYWVFEVSDPTQLPPEMVRQLGGAQPNQILVILGSLYVYSVDDLTLNPNGIDIAVNDIVRSRSNQSNNGGSGSDSSSGGSTGESSSNVPIRSRTNEVGNSIFSGSGDTPIVFGGSTPSPLDNINGTTGSTGGGHTGGVSGGDNGGGVSGGNNGGSGCTLKVFCEDPATGDQFTPGASGCQGADFYAQTPTPPTGTRQVSQCVQADGTTGSNCPEEFWFYHRNCMADLYSRELPNAPGNFDITGLPTGPGGPAGTLFTADPTFPGSTSRTIRCSYGPGRQVEAIQCGMPMSGEYCLPGYTPADCAPPPPDF